MDSERDRGGGGGGGERERERERFIRNNLHNGVVSGEEEEESLFMANAVNEEDSERDRATRV